MQTFPEDVNGDVFRRMQATGDRLDQPRDIDFNHVFEKEEEALLFANAVRQLGCEITSYRFWDQKKVWNARVVIFMTPTYADVTRIELQFDAIAREFLGRADGWGCFAVK